MSEGQMVNGFGEDLRMTFGGDWGFDWGDREFYWGDWGGGREKSCSSDSDLIPGSSLCEHPVEDGLYHNDKDDKEDEVSVEVGVAVPLLLLVETHLYAVIQFSNTVTDVLLLLYEWRERCLQACRACSLARLRLLDRSSRGVLITAGVAFLRMLRCFSSLTRGEQGL